MLIRNRCGYHKQNGRQTRRNLLTSVLLYSLWTACFKSLCHCNREVANIINYVSPAVAVETFYACRYLLSDIFWFVTWFSVKFAVTCSISTQRLIEDSSHQLSPLYISVRQGTLPLCSPWTPPLTPHQPLGASTILVARFCPWMEQLWFQVVTAKLLFASG